MAFKDIRNSISTHLESMMDPEALRQAQIEEIFYEVSRELGMTESDVLFPSAEQYEQITIVYDKFSTRRRQP